MKNIILSVKLKNAIKKSAPNMNLDFHLKNIIINGDKRGCSGFITNHENNSVVYVTTEPIMNLGYMYRYADNTNDFTGYHNRWAKTQDELVSNIIELLKKTPAEAGDSRL